MKNDRGKQENPSCFNYPLTLVTQALCCGFTGELGAVFPLYLEALLQEEKENWQRAQSPQQLTVEQATQLIGECAPLARKTVARLEVLSGGLMNTNYRVHFVGSEWSVVLRFYLREPTACAREVALLRLVSSDVPVAGVLHAEPDGI